MTDGTHLHVPAKLGRLLKIKLHRPLEGTPSRRIWSCG